MTFKPFKVLQGRVLVPMKKILRKIINITVLSLLLVSCVSIPSKTKLVGDAAQLAVKGSFECDPQSLQKAIYNSVEPVDQLDRENISVMNWNIYKTQRENWAEDFKKLIKPANILILQEATASPQVKSLLSKKHANWQLNTAFYYEGYETGVLTASSIKPVFSCGLRTTEPIIRVPKTVLINLYPLSGTHEKLLVANLHGVNFTLGTGTYSKQIQDLISVVIEHTGPLIIAGDFNTWSESRISIVRDMADKLFLNAVKYKAHNRVRVFGHALDHVYYRGLSVSYENVLHVSSSDHNPISVNFRLKDSRVDSAVAGLIDNE